MAACLHPQGHVSVPAYGHAMEGRWAHRCPRVTSSACPTGTDGILVWDNVYFLLWSRVLTSYLQ